MIWILLLAGVFFVFLGLIGCIKAPGIWARALKDYKKLPKNKRTIYNKPNKTVYFFHYFLLFPIMMLGGFMLIYYFWILK